MTATRTSALRLVVEIGAASAALVGTATIGLLGVVQWFSTVLEATYPCGETYRVHPSCRLAHPELVQQAWWLMTAVPALCLAGGLLVGALTFLRWRHAITGPAVGFALALTACLTARPMLAAALHDVVPW